MLYDESMEKWKKIILYTEGMPVKVYVNQHDTRTVVFPLFGRYHGISSDKSALDLTVEIMFHVTKTDSVLGVRRYSQYIDCQEDTAITDKEAV